jgi:hypothetical protein
VKTPVAAVLICLLAAGCGGAATPRTKPISGPAKQVATVIERFQRATARRDYATICDDLFAASARSQVGGGDCATVLAARARGVRRPRIVIQSIEVQGPRARARVRTTARGQAATSDTISLVRERGQFRVLSLGR